MSNTRIWDSLGKTDPKHTKAFERSGGFKGTAIRPIWLDLQMTERFGPCGVGWGVDKPEFTLVPANNELMVYCTVCLWYKDAQDFGRVFGVGGDKVLAQFSKGPRTDDEAFKKSFTDAIGNAMKFLGAAADIHMGMFEDTKYVQEVNKEYREEEERGSKEAAKAVAEKKIARAKATGESVSAPLPADPAPAEPKNAFKEMLRSFGELKEQLKAAGLEAEYYTVLEFYGVRHANEFKDFAAARECYKALVRGVAKLKSEEKLVNA